MEEREHTHGKIIVDIMWLERVELKLNYLIRRIRQMAIDQETFDSDLAALVTSISELTTAVDTWIAAHPDVDFSAEEAMVQQAAQTVKDELDKLTPAAPPEPATP